MDATSLTVLVTGLFGTVLGSFITLVTIMLKSNKAQSDASNKVITTLTDVIQVSAEATQALTKETKKGNKEAEKRNGHLAEISQQGTDRIIDKMQEQQGILAVNTKNVAMHADKVRVDLEKEN